MDPAHRKDFDPDIPDTPASFSRLAKTGVKVKSDAHVFLLSQPSVLLGKHYFGVGFPLSEFENYAELPSSSPSTADIGSGYFDHIKKINDIFYDQIKISDQKAAYIFTFMLAFLVSSVEVRAVFTWVRYAQGTPQAILFSGLLATASVFSILSAILVVLPRRLDKSTSMFWGAWPRHREVFFDAAIRRDERYLFDQYVENADILSHIARSKYRFVTIAFRGLMVTVVAYVLLLVAA